MKALIFTVSLLLLIFAIMGGMKMADDSSDQDVSDLPRKGEVTSSSNQADQAGALSSRRSGGNAQKLRRLWSEQAYDDVLVLFDAWLKEDSDGAIQFLVTAEKPIQRSHFVSRLADHLASLPPLEALEMAAPLASVDQGVYFGSITESIRLWADDSKVDVLKWLNGSGNSGLAQTLANSGVLGIESATLPVVLSELKDGEIKDELVNGMLFAWLVKDPEEAANFMNQLPETQNLDRVSLRYIDSVSSESHEIALQWAGLLTNPDLQKTITHELEQTFLSECEHCRQIHEQAAKGQEAP